MALSEWSSVEDLAKELAVPVRTVYSWRAKGTAPRAHTIGRYLRFRRADVEAWLAQQADDSRGAA